MLGSSRRGLTAGVAVMVWVAGPSYVLAGAAAPATGTDPVTEFTPDGKLKNPSATANGRTPGRS